MIPANQVVEIIFLNYLMSKLGLYNSFQFLLMNLRLKNMINYRRNFLKLGKVEIVHRLECAKIIRKKFSKLAFFHLKIHNI